MEKKSVLIADDQTVNRILLKKLLSGQDIHIKEAGGGREALELIRTENFDFVLLDRVMPDLSGVDVVSGAFAFPLSRKPCFIIISGEEEPIEEDILRSFGVRDFLLKPVRKQELYRILGLVAKEEKNSGKQPEITKIQEDIRFLRAVAKSVSEQLYLLEKVIHDGKINEFWHSALHTLLGVFATAEEHNMMDVVRRLQEITAGEELLSGENAERIGKLVQKIRDWYEAYLLSLDASKIHPEPSKQTEKEERLCTKEEWNRMEADLLKAFRIFDYDKTIELLEKMKQFSRGEKEEVLEEAIMLASNFQYDESLDLLRYNKIVQK